MDGIKELDKFIANQQLAEMTKQKIYEFRHLLSHHDNIACTECERLIQEIETTIMEHYEEIRYNVGLHKFYLSCGDYYSNLNDEKTALEYYNRMHFETYRIKTPYRDKEVTLLSFRKYSTYVLEDLINSEITLSNPLLMNDPFDSIALLWSNQNNWLRISKGIRKNHEYYMSSFRKYRIRSFTGNKITSRKNNLMWAHYADEHKGFCIEYCLMPEFQDMHNMEDLSFRVLQKVDYDKNNNDVLKQDSLSTSDAFASKDKVWKYENEVRLLSFNPNYTKDFVKIPLGRSCISAIYFGFRCPEETMKVIQNILGESVCYYKMTQSDGKLYSLYPKRIK